ncbi:MAG: NAD(P)/FAD-dependent oxidoreductase [Halobacteriaceae archaeon]
MTVAVVGGGCVGVTAARELARAGVDVTLFEADHVGGGSTGRAAGVLYAVHADAVNAALGRESLEAFRSLSGTGAFTFVPTPYVWFATDPGRDATAIRRHVEELSRLGADATLVDPADLGRQWPAMHTDDIEAAAVSHAAGWADPADYAVTVADQARAAGVTIHEDTPVTVAADPPRIRRDGTEEEVTAIAVAAGAHTPSLLAEAAIQIPVKPYRVQALTVPGPSTPMFWDVTVGYYARPHPTGVLAGDGTQTVEADPDAWVQDGDDAFVAAVTARLDHRLETVGVVDRAWAGLCTATPDRDPLLGKVAPGLFVATGWQGHGVMRAPATGARLATAVKDDTTPEPRFDPTRFSGDEDFAIEEGMGLPD